MSPVTDWQVKSMIADAIREYDGINTERHAEHTKKLDRMLYLLLTILAGFATDVIVHLLK